MISTFVVMMKLQTTTNNPATPAVFIYLMKKLGCFKGGDSDASCRRGSKLR